VRRELQASEDFEELMLLRQLDEEASPGARW
jgi:hypothetical protein